MGYTRLGAAMAVACVLAGLAGCGGAPQASGTGGGKDGHQAAGQKGRMAGSKDAAQSGRKGSKGGKMPAGVRTGSKGASGSPFARWVTAQDAAAKTVTFKVVAGYNGVAGGFNFDGGANGKMIFTVPADWKVTLDVSNQAAVPHSALVSASRTGTAPAFPGAGTPDPTAGMAKGKTATVTFTASKAGTYYLVCAVPGHEAAGMWDKFLVSSSAKSATATG